MAFKKSLPFRFVGCRVALLTKSRYSFGEDMISVREGTDREPFKGVDPRIGLPNLLQIATTHVKLNISYLTSHWIIGYACVFRRRRPSYVIDKGNTPVY